MESAGRMTGLGGGGRKKMKGLEKFPAGLHWCFPQLQRVHQWVWGGGGGVGLRSLLSGQVAPGRYDGGVASKVNEVAGSSVRGRWLVYPDPKGAWGAPLRVGEVDSR